MYLLENKTVRLSLIITLSVVVVGVLSLIITNYVTADNKKDDDIVDINNEIDDKTGSDIVELTEEEREEVESQVLAPEVNDGDLVVGDDTLSILLLGVDSRAGTFTGRSDALMVLTVNKKSKDAKLLSIPRDSYVWIEGKGFYDKINHAHAFGRAEMTKGTVENLLGIDIDYYATVNFNSFVDTIDVLGGVELEVPFNFSEKDRFGNYIYFNQGIQTLSGEEALAYARMRKQDPKGDIGRGERQQDVIKALLDKATEFKSLTKVTDVFNIVRNNVETDVKVFDLVDLLPYATSVGNLETLNLDGRGKMINGVYYYELDSISLDNVRRELQEHLSNS